ncbi:MAG TPA: hypothetical protein PKE29_01815 [Phycisphaerales bacterium]|nr:hypothetical protein [Phycisphaerales bacterium]
MQSAPKLGAAQTSLRFTASIAAAAFVLALAGCEGMMQAALELGLQAAQPRDRHERVEYWASTPRDLRPIEYSQADRELRR